MGNRLILEFSVGDSIIALFAVTTCELRDFALGEFLSQEQGDWSGRVPAIMWEPDQITLTDLEPGMVVKIRGEVTQYQELLVMRMTYHRKQPLTVGYAAAKVPELFTGCLRYYWPN